MQFTITPDQIKEILLSERRKENHLAETFKTIHLEFYDLLDGIEKKHKIPSVEDIIIDLLMPGHPDEYPKTECPKDITEEEWRSAGGEPTSMKIAQGEWLSQIVWDEEFNDIEFMQCLEGAVNLSKQRMVLV